MLTCHGRAESSSREKLCRAGSKRPTDSSSWFFSCSSSCSCSCSCSCTCSTSKAIERCLCRADWRSTSAYSSFSSAAASALRAPRCASASASARSPHRGAAGTPDGRSKASGSTKTRSACTSCSRASEVPQRTWWLRRCSSARCRKTWASRCSPSTPACTSSVRIRLSSSHAQMALSACSVVACERVFCSSSATPRMRATSVRTSCATCGESSRLMVCPAPMPRMRKAP
mmetsp:Transcript_14391/g.46053  ORF Transcript_14391/g.46053 Transcript_14391/m.46053 type:complete len:229 (+) Transcript_14391:209-895(+)